MFKFLKNFVLLSLLLSFTLSFSTRKVNAQACYTFSYHLSIGSTDANTEQEVSKLQAYFYKIGLLNITPTGYFGNLTFNAVIGYQNIKGINDVGEIGPITRSSLNSECFTGVDSNPITPLYHFAPINSDISCTEIQYDLQRGDRDYVLYGNVLQLQSFLYQNSLMYYAPTGYFGPLTEAGVKKYQGLRKIPQTGILDFPTRYILAKETCNGTTSLTLPVMYRSVIVQ